MFDQVNLVYNPAGIYLFKVNNWKQDNVWNLFRVKSGNLSYSASRWAGLYMIEILGLNGWSTFWLIFGLALNNKHFFIFGLFLIRFCIWFSSLSSSFSLKLLIIQKTQYSVFWRLGKACNSDFSKSDTNWWSTHRIWLM